MKPFLFVAMFSALGVLPLVHPFGPVRQQHAAEVLAGVKCDNARVLSLFARACENCHSEQTKWPLYSYLPIVSWALEKDVAEARRHMDLSQWQRYSPAERLDLLARIAVKVRERQMPLHRYVLLHPEARLSDAEVQLIYDWTKAERRAIRKEMR